MKIFGLDINFKKNKKLPLLKHTEAVTINTVTPSTKPISKIPLVGISTLNYASRFNLARGQFLGSDFDLSEVGKIVSTESYVRQAFKKKEALMFKEGINIQGKNKQTIQYYKARIAQIAKASGIPTNQLKKRIAISLIHTSNAFLIKVRNPKASGGQIRRTPSGKKLLPVAAYFPAAPETMKVNISAATGRPLQWRQEMPDGRYIEFDADDVIHFTLDKQEGFLFGTPILVPVADDIRALRQIEENIELLLYQHLFPLYHYKVGTETAPAGYTEDGYKEIDLIKDEIEMMPSEGAIVTPERHEITAIGAEGRAIRAEGYIDHFKKRVFAGLGVSGVDLGEGESSTKATAFSLSKALVDSIKAIQDEFESQWNEFVISELLLESTFGDNVLDEESMVHIQFREIDLRSKIELEQHYLNLWDKNVISQDEFRNQVGLEPMILPEDREDYDLNKYPEWSRTLWKLIEEPRVIYMARDEPGTPEARAALKSSPNKLAKSSPSLNNPNPGAPPVSPRNRQPRLKNNYLQEDINLLKQDIINRINENIDTRDYLDTNYLVAMIRTWLTDSSSKLQSNLLSKYNSGFQDETGYSPETIQSFNKISKRYVDKLVNSLSESLINLFKSKIDKRYSNVKLIEAKHFIFSDISIVFDLLKHRVNAIWDTEHRRAYLFGKINGLKFLGYEQVQLESHPDSCKRCQALNDLIISTNIKFENSPPYHPNSRIDIKRIKN